MNMNILYVVGPLFAIFAMLMMIALTPSTDPYDEVHCDDCPSVECQCIQDVKGNWMLSPEVGE